MQVRMEMEISLLKIILHYKIFNYKKYFFINKGLGSPSISNFYVIGVNFGYYLILYYFFYGYIEPPYIYAI